LKTAVVLGTRPEIIKMSPVIRELEKRNADYFIIHIWRRKDWAKNNRSVTKPKNIVFGK
jgi:UDP-N-acetylglucosamine 2-epimerase